MITAAITGFVTGFSLILAIGAQNAFVLRQGLMQAHVFWVCLVCALSDALLITLGVAGAGSIGAAFPWAIAALTWGGVVFLTVYGALSFGRALRPAALKAAEQGAGSLRMALATCLTLTWLNPHVYLDTVGLIGAISTGFPDINGKLAYGLGAILASFVFFFGLGYSARLVAPVFARPRAWALLDVGIAFVMWALAANLLFGAPGQLLHAN